MADSFPVDEGVTGWVVTNRRTRNVERADQDPLVAVVEGTEMEPESLVSVPLLVERPRRGRAQRLPDRDRQAVQRGRGRAGRALRDDGGARVRLRAPARHAARAGAHRRAHRACSTTAPATSGWARRSRAPRRSSGRSASSSLDLDHFKTVNDAYGHAEGDKVLDRRGRRSCARRCATDDLVARLGGEEFALILPGVDGDAGRGGRRARARRDRRGRASAARALSCSAGVASYPDDARDAGAPARARRRRAVLGQALGPRPEPPLRPAARRAALGRRPARRDRGAAGATRARSCRCSSRCSSSPPGASPATRRSRGCRTARSGRPTSGSTRRTAPGSAPALEAAALRAALRAHDRPERTFLALNVSPGALLSPEVRAALPDDLAGIVIELTEHELFSTDARARPRAGRCCARAARGSRSTTPATATPGLQQIIRIAPDILKLDRSLVDGVHDDPHRFALLEALISFASTTRAAVCAEGVETLEDLAVLAAMDVTYAQGWALARPDAPWAALAPQAAAAASAEVRIGMRVAREPHDDAAPTLGDLIARLTTVSCVEDIRDVAAMIPAVLGADDAAVSRVVPGEGCVEDISRHGWSKPGRALPPARLPGDRVRAAHAHGRPGRRRRPGVRSRRGRAARAVRASRRC